MYENRKNSEPGENGNSPIYNEELERMVLASMINSFQAVVDCESILTPDCFYNLRHQEIFAAIMQVYNQGENPDLVFVSRQLAKNGSLVTNIDLAKLCVESSQVFDLYQYASILREYMIRRKMWEAGYALMSQSSSESIDIESVHNEIKGKIDTLFDDNATSGLITLEDIYKDLQKEIIANTERKPGEIRGTPTGFELIDGKGGLCPGQLIIVGAETSQGKTSFAMALTISAISHGHPVAFYSMEMMAIELGARIASMMSGIQNTRILNERMSSEEIFKIDDSMAGLDMSLLHVDERSTSSFDRIVNSIRMMKMKYNIKGAVIDYLQLINFDGIKDATTREQKVGACSHALKNLTKQLGIWIILISQLNRNSQNPIPTMARLRDSGQIEEAADVVFLIYRPGKGLSYPEPFKDKTTQGTAMINLAKGRGIGTGEFLCGFKAENTLFYPLDENLIRSYSLSSQFPVSPKSTKQEDLENLPF